MVSVTLPCSLMDVCHHGPGRQENVKLLRLKAAVENPILHGCFPERRIRKSRWIRLFLFRKRVSDLLRTFHLKDNDELCRKGLFVVNDKYVANDNMYSLL
jgi:hypothetical protein